MKLLCQLDIIYFFFYYFLLKELWKHYFILMKVCSIFIHMPWSICLLLFRNTLPYRQMWPSNSMPAAHLLTFSKLWLFYVATLFCFIILAKESSLWSAKRCFYLNHWSHIHKYSDFQSPRNTVQYFLLSK